jgi:hypothetical protein
LVLGGECAALRLRLWYPRARYAIGHLTKLLTDSRNQARDRMWREARARGANAIVAMRFDCNEIGDIMSEVAAYGTAVTVVPLEAPAADAASTPGRHANHAGHRQG